MNCHHNLNDGYKPSLDCYGLEQHYVPVQLFSWNFILCLHFYHTWKQLSQYLQLQTCNCRPITITTDFIALMTVLLKMETTLYAYTTAFILKWNTGYIGGGFALSDASLKSGLSEWLGVQLAGLSSLPPFLIMFIVYIWKKNLITFHSFHFIWL